MYMILDGASDDLLIKIGQTSGKGILHTAAGMSATSTEDLTVAYTEYVGIYSSSIGEARFYDLALASQGVLLWSNNPDYKYYATYMGNLPETDVEIEKCLKQFEYCQTRVNLFKSYGVKYVGRVYLDPKDILLLDNRPGKELIDPKNRNEVLNILSSLTDEWWHTFAIVSSGNIEKLEEFFFQIDNVIPVVYTTGGQSKLKFMGRDYVTIVPPREDNDLKFGVDIRERTNRLSHKLSYK